MLPLERLKQPGGGILLAKHTPAYFSGFMSSVLIMVLASGVSQAEDGATLIFTFILCWFALLVTGLFTLGIAWGGVAARLPSVKWAASAGIITGMGGFLLGVLLDWMYAVTPAELQQGLFEEVHPYTAAWMVAYTFFAPILVGMLTAILWKRHS